MENFIFQNPVKLIMGRGMIARLDKEIPAGKRVMITFGGGSVKKNGVYDQVKEALKDYFTVEFWGTKSFDRNTEKSHRFGEGKQSRLPVGSRWWFGD